MNMRRLILAGLIALPLQLSASTGNEILSDCPALFANDPEASPEAYMNGARCMGYVQGLSDMAVVLMQFTKTPIYCLPEEAGLETGQIVRVFVKWLEANPAVLHESAR